MSKNLILRSLHGKRLEGSARSQSLETFSLPLKNGIVISEFRLGADLPPVGIKVAECDRGRTFALTKKVEHRSRETLREKLTKIGANRSRRECRPFAMNAVSRMLSAMAAMPPYTGGREVNWPPSQDFGNYSFDRGRGIRAGLLKAGQTN